MRRRVQHWVSTQLAIEEVRAGSVNVGRVRDLNVVWLTYVRGCRAQGVKRAATLREMHLQGMRRKPNTFPTGFLEGHTTEMG
eukprot:2649777-Pleurochrysis_carterae.AAC.1